MKGQTLLLADDSVTTHRVVALTFAEHGLRVVSVSDGQQAIEKLSTERPDIVLAAINMPKADGYEVARFIRSQPALQHVPVLLLRGAFDAVDDQRARESGAAGVLVKPIESAIVINRVKELLGMRTKAAPQPALAAGRLVTPAEPPPMRSPTAPRGVGAPRSAPSARAPATAAASEPGPDDYFEKLDAAFDTLDAQLSGRRREAAPASARAESPAVAGPESSAVARPESASSDGGTSPASDGVTSPASYPPSLARPSDAGYPPSLARPSDAGFGEAGRTEPVTPQEPERQPVYEVDSGWFPKPGLATEPPEPPASAHTESASARTDSSAGARPESAASYGVTSPASSPPSLARPSDASSGEAGGAAGPVAKATHVADAFDAMLAAEQDEGRFHHAPVVEISDDVIERIALRVAERLSEGVFMDTVTHIVSAVTERMVREEIARIRAAAQTKKS